MLVRLPKITVILFIGFGALAGLVSGLDDTFNVPETWFGMVGMMADHWIRFFWHTAAGIIGGLCFAGMTYCIANMDQC